MIKNYNVILENIKEELLNKIGHCEKELEKTVGSKKEDKLKNYIEGLYDSLKIVRKNEKRFR